MERSSTRIGQMPPVSDLSPRSRTDLGQMPPVSDLSPRSRTPNPDMLTRARANKKKEGEGKATGFIIISRL